MRKMDLSKGIREYKQQFLPVNHFPLDKNEIPLIFLSSLVLYLHHGNIIHPQKNHWTDPGCRSYSQYDSLVDQWFFVSSLPIGLCTDI